MTAPPETADAFERLLTQWEALLPAYVAARADVARLEAVLTDLIAASCRVAGAYRIRVDAPYASGRLTLANSTPDGMFAAALTRALRALPRRTR